MAQWSEGWVGNHLGTSQPCFSGASSHSASCKAQGSLAVTGSFVHLGQGKVVSVHCPLLPYPPPHPHCSLFEPNAGNRHRGLAHGSLDEPKLEQADRRSGPKAELSHTGPPLLLALLPCVVRDSASDRNKMWALGSCCPRGSVLPSAPTVREGFRKA